MLSWRRELWADLIMVREEILGLEKCIKQLAQNVEKNAKFHSNPLKASPFIAENATERREDFNSIVV